MSITLRCLVVRSAFAFAFGAPAGATAMFTGLGFTNFSANGVSADGSVVVGESGSGAFRWTQAGGVETLGALPGGHDASWALAASSDGTGVVGGSYSGDGAFDYEPFRWTAAGGMIGLGTLPGGSAFQATAVSDDGSVIAGRGLLSDGSLVAFRWTESEGLVPLEVTSGGPAEAFGISADGSVIVGWDAALTSFGQAVRWTAADGAVGLGDLPGGDDYSIAYAASAEGSVVVGESGTDVGVEAFRWTEAEGMVSLGHLPGPGGELGSASGVSADGSVIVGGSGEAFIWDPLNGMRSLKAVLESDYGLDLTGWILQYAEDVSADGHTVVGWGLNPDGQSEGWVAQLDAPVAEPGASLLAAAGLLALASRGAVEARRSSSSPAARARGGR